MTYLLGEILEMIAEDRDMAEFETRLLEEYGLDDSLRMITKDVMDRVDLPREGRNTLTILQEFEKRKKGKTRRKSAPYSRTKTGSPQIRPW